MTSPVSLRSSGISCFFLGTVLPFFFALRVSDSLFSIGQRRVLIMPCANFLRFVFFTVSIVFVCAGRVERVLHVALSYLGLRSSVSNVKVSDEDGFCRAAHVSPSPLHTISHCSSRICFGCALSENIRCGFKDLSRWNPRTKVFSVVCWIYLRRLL